MDRYIIDKEELASYLTSGKYINTVTFNGDAISFLTVDGDNACSWSAGGTFTFTLLSDNTYGVSVSGNPTTLHIPSTHKGKPVTRFMGVTPNKFLKTVYIPTSIKIIDEGAFDLCSSITAMYYRGNVAQWLNIEFGDSPGQGNTNYYFNSTETLLTVLNISSDIPARAFYGCASLEEVYLGGSHIGEYAFEHCSNINYIELYSGVKTIEQGAFWVYSETAPSVITEENPHWISNGAYVTDMWGAFQSGNPLTSFTIKAPQISATVTKDTSYVGSAGAPDIVEIVIYNPNSVALTGTGTVNFTSKIVNSESKIPLRSIAAKSSYTTTTANWNSYEGEDVTFNTATIKAWFTQDTTKVATKTVTGSEYSSSSGGQT